MVTIFVPREVEKGETRVALTPTTAKSLVTMGFKVYLEKGAGEGSLFGDRDYQEVGVEVTEDLSKWGEADLVLKLHPPKMGDPRDEVVLFKEGAVLVSFLWPLWEKNKALVEALAERKVSAFAMDLIPRITRAQSMDALTSQASIGGYKAAIFAANHLRKLLPLMMTPSGTIKPAKFVILGAGVAGLQALATAQRLGAVVEVSDIRPSTKEQVESLGGKFIEIETSENLEDKSGYAKEVGEDFLKRQREVLTQHLKTADAVITTARVPGKKPPLLITKEMLSAMKKGSVVIDMAASDLGGNCELSKPDEEVEFNGIKIFGPQNLPATLPVDASSMYANNVLKVVQLLYPNVARRRKAEEGQEPPKLELNFEDEIIAGSIATHGGEIVHPKVREVLNLPPKEEKKAEESEGGEGSSEGEGGSEAKSQ